MLVQLVLHKNNLGDKGAQCLALTTINCPSLAKLDLSSGDIREAGARAVGNMMLESAMVSELNFSGNRLGVKVRVSARRLAPKSQASPRRVWGIKWWTRAA